MAQLLAKQTVLVVDDTAENLDLLSEILGGEYRVRVATNGEKALRIIYSDEPPDIILLDIMMPGLSGYDVCRRLKANPDRRRIPVIFVTAMTSVDDERLGLEMGAVWRFMTRRGSLSGWLSSARKSFASRVSRSYSVWDALLNSRITRLETMSYAWRIMRV